MEKQQSYQKPNWILGAVVFIFWVPRLLYIINTALAWQLWVLLDHSSISKTND